jgi:hypothetical protein
MKLSVLLTLLMTCVPFSSLMAVGANVDRTVPRVRAADARIKRALAEGQRRSASFRRVLQRVEELDVIVYAEMQPLLRNRLSGATTWVTATKDFRYVRVSLNPELSSWQVVASLAHELHHVAEIGSAPSIVDTRTLTTYYQEVGIGKSAPSDQWETEAARVTGENVRRELAVSAAAGNDGSGEMGLSPVRE